MDKLELIKEALEFDFSYWKKQKKEIQIMHFIKEQ